MPEMGPTRAFVVWSRDGAPLPADEGPLRLVVTTDHKGSRSTRQLTGLRVVEMPPPTSQAHRREECRAGHPFLRGFLPIHLAAARLPGGESPQSSCAS
jgi:hypothetical protein